MSLDFLYSANEWLIALVFLAMLLLAGEGGFRLGHRIESRVEETTKSQITGLQGAMLALFGLLLAFTFSMAVSRYDLRKQLVVEESTSIGTTYLRAQLLPEPHRAEISRLLRGYVDVRLEFFAVGADPQRVAQVNDETERIQDELWSQAIAAGAIDPHAETTSLFLQSLNETIDLPTKRLAALQNRIPEVVILLLLFGGILAVGVVGYGYGLGAHRNIFLMITFSVLIALVVLVIIDLDRPRRGLITVSQQSMLDLRESLGRSKPWDEQGFWNPNRGSWLCSGVPAAYPTFLGYDEEARHSGVQSKDAFDVLSKLDKRLAPLETAARGALCPYHLLALFDHGQTGGTMFKQRYGMTLEALVRDIGSSAHRSARTGEPDPAVQSVSHKEDL